MMQMWECLSIKLATILLKDWGGGGEKLAQRHLYCLLGEGSKLCLHVNFDRLKQIQEMA